MSGVPPNQLMALIENRLTFLPGKRIITSDHLWTQTATLPWVSNLWLYAVDFGATGPP